MMRTAVPFIAFLALTSCSSGATGVRPSGTFTIESKASFNEPWAMAFLPDGSILVTERSGGIKLRHADGRVADVTGAPKADVGGQGGMGDIVIDPEFERNRKIWLSWVEPGQRGTRGAVVAHAVLSKDATAIGGLTIVWRQDKAGGRGHFGHRLAFAPDGALFISSGERQKFVPAQDDGSNLGKMIRLHDGKAEIWAKGLRNPLGIAFDDAGRLWETEMGPAGGDEVNLIRNGANYGWPRVSNGSHYDGQNIPDHAAGDGYEPPKVWWNPSISPGALAIYRGDIFKGWKGDAFVAALGGQALIRLDIEGENARKAEHWDMEARIRSVVSGPDGALWLLEDGPGGRLLRLMPRPIG